MKTKLIVFATIVASIIFSGCSIWSNFSTYFNTYYNAKENFRSAEKIINDQKKPIFDVTETQIPSSVNPFFIKVTEKCSKILQYHSKSSYVDDALMMLGKTLYYQKNYQKALRKFQELRSTQPESDLYDENELWIAKTFLKLKDFDKAYSALKALIAKKDVDSDILQQAEIEMVKYYYMKEDYNEAIKQINLFVSVSISEEDQAEALYEKGKLFVRLSNVDSAVKTFESVRKLMSSPEVDFNSKLDLVKAYRETKQFDEGLKVLDNLMGQTKYKDKKDFIELEKALTYVAQDRKDEALVLLTKVDTAYPQSMNSNIAKLRKAELFEYKLNNYDSAATYYSKALNSSLINLKDLGLIAMNKDVLFKKYRTYLTNIFDLSKQYLYVTDTSAFRTDSIAYNDTVNAIAERGRKKAIEDSLSFNKQNLQPINTQALIQAVYKPIRPMISADSIHHQLVRNKFELGNLFFTEFNRLDSAYSYYTEILTNYPNSIYEARTLFALGSYYLTKNDTLKADSLFSIVYNNYRGEQIANAAAVELDKPLIEFNTDSNSVLYREAEKELIKKNYKDAASKFYRIYKNDPKSSIAPKAMYASAFILENNLKLRDSAAAIYDTLMVRYSSTVYGQKTIPKVMAWRQEQDRIKRAIQDSLNAIEKHKTDSLSSVQHKLDSLNNLKKGLDSLKNVDKTPTMLDKNKQTIDSIANSKNKLKRVLDSIKSQNKDIKDTTKTEVDNLNKPPDDLEKNDSLPKDSVKTDTNMVVPKEVPLQNSSRRKHK